MADQLFCAKRIDWDAPVTEVLSLGHFFQQNPADLFCLVGVRQTTGFVESLLRLSGLNWGLPSFSTLSRWQKTLQVTGKQAHDGQVRYPQDHGLSLV